MITIETYDADNNQYLVTDYLKPKWSSHYGKDGSGFGYLKFALPRKIGHNYADIGDGYRVILRKHLNTILFDGSIREIVESSEPGGDKINVVCLGQLIVAQDDEILRTFCDTRLGEWRVESEVPRGSFRPDRFNIGSNNIGLFLHAANNATAEVADYTELVYEFFTDETAERFKCDLSLQLGSGSAFDGRVDSIDSVNGYVDYKDDAGEGNVAQGMTLYNTTRDSKAIVDAVNIGTNRITVTVPGAISSWVTNDELAIYGPLFSALIDSISTDTITYSGDIVGEGNIAASQALANISQKSIATVQSNNTGANTITVTDSDHIDGWEAGDLIVIGAPYFEAALASDSGVTITYSSPVGERIASSTTGWVLHNVTENEYAVVASWNIGSNQLDVTDAGDITAAWTNGDTLRIYTPYRVEILDSADAILWPASDWRQGAVPHDKTSINVTTGGSPTQFKIKFKTYIAGTGDESSFVQLSSVKVYSTTEDANVTMLAKYVISLLSVSGHGLSSSEEDIEDISNTLEPMVFEFETLADALSWACGFGDGANNPIAWGVKLDSDKQMFLETQDQNTIDYVIRRTAPVSASVGGDLQGSVQQVRAIYTDKMEKRCITAWQTAPDAYFANHYRRASIRLDNVDNDTDAVSFAQLYLEENKNPKRNAKYSASDGSIFTMAGLPVSFDEVQATGRLIMLEDWRAVEVEGATDLRQAWTTEQIVIVEVDYDAGKVSLTPAGATSTFEQYMAELALLAQR